ncbi:aminoglycoside 6-adenylyltransferase [Paenibacillus chitinolyticus]
MLAYGEICAQKRIDENTWRDELPYVKQMFEQVIRPHLDEMIAWWVCTKKDFPVSIGKMGNCLGMRKEYFDLTFEHETLP